MVLEPHAQQERPHVGFPPAQLRSELPLPGFCRPVQGPTVQSRPMGGAVCQFRSKVRGPDFEAPRGLLPVAVSRQLELEQRGRGPASGPGRRVEQGRRGARAEDGLLLLPLRMVQPALPSAFRELRCRAHDSADEGPGGPLSSLRLVDRRRVGAAQLLLAFHAIPGVAVQRFAGER